MSRKCRRWLKDEIKQTIKLIKEGKTYDEISEITGRPRNAIRVKLGQLGETYLKYNPYEIRYCENCGSKIEGCGKKFCSRSCSVTYNNKLRREVKMCGACGKQIKRYGENVKYCDRKCFNDYRKKLKWEEIEKGECKTEYTKIYKKYLIEKYGENCMDCGWCEVNPHSNNIPLELHHVDGNPSNNNLNNLELLCPNCHSLKDNWKGIKSNGGRYSRRRIKRRERYANGESH